MLFKDALPQIKEVCQEHGLKVTNWNDFKKAYKLLISRSK